MIKTKEESHSTQSTPVLTISLTPPKNGLRKENSVASRNIKHPEKIFSKASPRKTAVFHKKEP
jgi:hypothetical protein